MTILPKARPDISLDRARELARNAGWLLDSPLILGRRGYYKDTMGVAGKNDRGMYDDAIVLVTPEGITTFNANTDPSPQNIGSPLAVLVPGVYSYKIGTHHPGTSGSYTCLVQDGNVTVKRDDGVVETGEFYIHIHRGGYNTTSSLGCQTIHPDQWNEFLGKVATVLRNGKLKNIPYVLTENV